MAKPSKTPSKISPRPKGGKVKQSKVPMKPAVGSKFPKSSSY